MRKKVQRIISAAARSLNSTGSDFSSYLDSLHLYLSLTNCSWRLQLKASFLTGPQANKNFKDWKLCGLGKRFIKRWLGDCCSILKSEFDRNVSTRQLMEFTAQHRPKLRWVKFRSHGDPVSSISLLLWIPKVRIPLFTLKFFIWGLCPSIGLIKKCGQSIRCEPP